MADQGEQDYQRLQDQIVALQQQLDAMRAGQPGPRTAAGTLRRRTARRRAMLATLFGLLLIAGGTALSAGDALDALFVSSEGNVGVRTRTPAAALDVAGDAIIRGKAMVSALVVSQEVGARSPQGAPGLTVGGDAQIAGLLSSEGRYQRNDEPETTETIRPRYHVSLTTDYAMRTRTIPRHVVERLCGDADGCEFRLGMTNWGGNQPAAASRTGLLYYSNATGFWRANVKGGDTEGTDGNGKTEHIDSAWGTCYFTDAVYVVPYREYDTERGLQLLVWNGSKDPKRTCELTIID